MKVKIFIISFLFFSNLYSQNVKKIFKEIKNKNICINKSGKEIIVLQKYDFDSPFYNGFAKVEDKVSHGLIDKNGKEIIPIKYDEVNYFNEGFAAVSKNGKWGFVDTNGNEIIPLKYDKVTNFSKGTAFAIENCEIILLKLYNHEKSKNEVYVSEQIEKNNNINEQTESKSTEIKNQTTREVFSVVDEYPVYAQGETQLKTSILSMIKQFKNKEIRGTCFVRFIVCPDGSISDVTITKSIPNCTECDEHVFEMMKRLSKWNPGKIGGKPVYTLMNMPIKFGN